MITTIAQALADPRLMRAAAKKLATEGINGDTILAHIGPREAALLKARGGVGTKNTQTGLPQFYDAGTDGSNLGGGQGDTATTGGDGSYGGANDGTAGAAASAAGPGMMDRAGHSIGGFLGQNSPPDANTLGPEPMSAQPDKSTYGGFLGSDGLQAGVGMAASALAGPFAGYAAKGITGLAQGKDLAHSFGATGGIMQSMMDHGTAGPASAQSQTNGTDAGQQGLPAFMRAPAAPSQSPASDQTAAMVKALGPDGATMSNDPTMMAAMLNSLRNRSQSIQ